MGKKKNQLSRLYIERRDKLRQAIIQEFKRNDIDIECLTLQPSSSSWRRLARRKT